MPTTGGYALLGRTFSTDEARGLKVCISILNMFQFIQLNSIYNDIRSIINPMQFIH